MKVAHVVERVVRQHKGARGGVRPGRVPHNDPPSASGAGWIAVDVVVAFAGYPGLDGEQTPATQGQKEREGEIDRRRYIYYFDVFIVGMAGSEKA